MLGDDGLAIAVSDVFGVVKPTPMVVVKTHVIDATAFIRRV